MQGEPTPAVPSEMGPKGTRGETAAVSGGASNILMLAATFEVGLPATS